MTFWGRKKEKSRKQKVSSVFLFPLSPVCYSSVNPLCYLCVLVCSPVKFRKRDAALFQNSLLADEHLLRVESFSILRLWFSGGSPLLSPQGANALFCFHAAETEKTTC